jgi:hypothetical protein
LQLSVQLPSLAGTYRLVTTIHGADGIAFDAATQVLVPVMTVRVSRPLSAAYGVVSSLRLPAGAATILPVRVVNDGTLAWADPIPVPEAFIEPGLLRAHPRARLVGHWVSLGVGDRLDDPSDLTVAIDIPPGREATLLLALIVPGAPGDYLLALDVNSPRHGSLAALGVPLGQVRVTVEPAATPIGGPGTTPAGISPGAP